MDRDRGNEQERQVACKELVAGGLFFGALMAVAGASGHSPDTEPAQPAEPQPGTLITNTTASTRHPNPIEAGPCAATTIPRLSGHPTGRLAGLLPATLRQVSSESTTEPAEPVATQVKGQPRTSLAQALQGLRQPVAPKDDQQPTQPPSSTRSTATPWRVAGDTTRAITPSAEEPHITRNPETTPRPRTRSSALRSLGAPASSDSNGSPDLTEPVFVDRTTPPKSATRKQVSWLQQALSALKRPSNDQYDPVNEDPAATPTQQTTKTTPPLASLHTVLAGYSRPLDAAGPDDRNTTPSTTAEPTPTTTKTTPDTTPTPTIQSTPQEPSPSASTTTPETPPPTSTPTETSPSPQPTSETTEPTPTQPTTTTSAPSSSPTPSQTGSTKSVKPTPTPTPSQTPPQTVNIGSIPIGTASNPELAEPVPPAAAATSTPTTSPESKTGDETFIEGAEYLGMHPGPNQEPIPLYAITGFMSGGEESDPDSQYYVKGAAGRVIVNREAAPKVVAMFKAAAKDGITLRANSSFRTIAHQEQLCDADKNGCGDGSDTSVVAKPGKSLHNFGHAIDFSGIIDGTKANCVIDRKVCVAPDDNKVFWWLAAKAHDYGYGLYAGNGQDNTGEAWHWDMTHRTPQWTIDKALDMYKKHYPDAAEAPPAVVDRGGYVSIGAIPIGGARKAKTDAASDMQAPVIPATATTDMHEVVTPSDRQTKAPQGGEADTQPEAMRPYQHVTAEKVMQLFPEADRDTIRKNWSYYPKYMELAGVGDVQMIAYSFANMSIESRQFDLPPEITRGRGRSYGAVDKDTGHAYYGRGNTQLTWKQNYKRVSDFINRHFRDRVHVINGGNDIDLVHNPDLLIQNPEIDAMAQAAFLALNEDKIRESGYNRSVYLGAERKNTTFDNNFATAMKWFR